MCVRLLFSSALRSEKATQKAFQAEDWGKNDNVTLIKRTGVYIQLWSQKLLSAVEVSHSSTVL